MAANVSRKMLKLTAVVAFIMLMLNVVLRSRGKPDLSSILGQLSMDTLRHGTQNLSGLQTTTDSGIVAANRTLAELVTTSDLDTTTDRQRPSSQFPGCPDEDFVTINPTGRLGNKLGQYASLWALYRTVLSPSSHQAYTLPEMHKELAGLFQSLRLPQLSEECARHSKQFRSVSFMKFKPSDLQPSGPLLLRDHPCRLTEFHRYRDELLQQLRWRTQLAAGAQQRMWQLSGQLCRRLGGGPEKPCTYVAVHVRRTDYAGAVRRMYNGALVGEDYLTQALALCRRRYTRTVFVVCSDDLDWCRQHLTAPDVAIAGGLHSAGEDMALLASCNHTVMTHGTYGFWAAYMAGGDVIVPTGFGERDSYLSGMMLKVKYNVTFVAARKLSGNMSHSSDTVP